jgi:hypothetical protein
MDKKVTGWVIVGGIFFLANILLERCGQEPDTSMPSNQSSTFSGTELENVMAQRSMGVMTMVQEVGPDDYKIVKEYPSRTTGVVVTKMAGSKQIIPEDKVAGVMDQAKSEKGFGLGTVLSAGLLGYMMGHNSSLSPYAYKDDSLYKQSLVNRDLIYRQQEEEDKRRGYSGYWNGGRYYSSSRTSPVNSVKSTSSGSTKTGFFSRLASSFRSSG